MKKLMTELFMLLLAIALVIPMGVIPAAADDDERMLITGMFVNAPGPAVPPGDVSNTRKAFVTDSRFLGDFGGRAAADAICQTEAIAASLVGIFRAWLSDSFVVAKERIPFSLGPWEQAGTTIVIVNNSEELFDGGGLVNPLELNASGQKPANPDPPEGVEETWTGTGVDGKGTGNYCTGVGGDWTSIGDVFGTAGLSTAVDSDWTNLSDPTCGLVPLRLYCFQVD